MNRLVFLDLRSRMKRVLWLLGFGALYVGFAIAARILAAGEHGQVEPDALFQFGGYPLVSILLLSGWSIAKYPLIIAIALISGLIDHDIRNGSARLFVSQRMSLHQVFGLRLMVLMLLAFVASAVLLPVFDVIMLGRLPGAQILILIATYVILYGTMTAFFSVLTRADAAATVFVAMTAIVWHTMLRAGLLDNAPPGLRPLVSTVLPPQSAINAVEQAFVANAAIPWSAFAHVLTYATLLLVVGGVVLARREI